MLCALVRQLAVEPVGVVALGLGVAPAIAALGAGLPAQRLVVYAPVYGPTTVRTRFRLLARLARQRRVAVGLAWLSRQERVLTVLRWWLGQEAVGSSSPSLEGGGRGVGPDETSVVADVRRASVRAAMELVHDAVTRDQRSQLARLAIPTLALAAPDDPLLPAAASFALVPPDAPRGSRIATTGTPWLAAARHCGAAGGHCAVLRSARTSPLPDRRMSLPGLGVRVAVEAPHVPPRSRRAMLCITTVRTH